jgi:hypothetical protein
MRAADRKGLVAEAWLSRAVPERPQQEASLVQWVVKGPFHPAWEYWVLAVISLEEIPGAPSAHKKYPEAEYELMIVSLNPECYPPDPDVADGLDFLLPIDLIYQFDGVSDAQAMEIASLAVQAICDGRISPDQDFRSVWEKALDATVRKYKAEAEVREESGRKAPDA